MSDPAMRIISWNCQGGISNKIEPLLKENPDICIIQECADPVLPKNRALVDAGFTQFCWTGTNPRKGLGVFARPHVKIEQLDWESYGLRYFLPFRIEDTFNLIAVWAMAPYIHEADVYFNVHRDKIAEDTVIMGDLNSNAIWDEQHIRRESCCHSWFVDKLSKVGLVSVYHHLYGERQGEEKLATFYMNRKQEKPFMIDHCFAPPSLIRGYGIGTYEEWHSYSDHCPIEFDLD